MNYIKILIPLTLIVVLVKCNFISDSSQLQQNIAKIYPLNETQLIAKIKSDLEFVDNSIDRRLADSQHLKVYSDLNDNFISFYKQFRKEFEKMFRKQNDPKKKKALLVRLATITTTMAYDEHWKAQHWLTNDMPESGQSLDELQQNFRQLMLKLNEVLTKNAENSYESNQMFWYHFYSRLSLFYMKIYITADFEANSLSANEKHKNLFVLNREIQRFLYLVSLGRQPKTRNEQKL